MKNDHQLVQHMVHGLKLGILKSDIRTKSIIPRALSLAFKVHEGQTRKGNGEPYIMHPLRVALSVSQLIQFEPAIAAALLHDTIEDTDTTFDDIEKEFGLSVARIVQDLTEPNKSLPWRERKLQLIDRIKDMDERSLAIKTADKIDNINSLYLDYMKQGGSVMKDFNAPLKEQIEIDKKIYEAIKKSFERFDSKGYIQLLTQLKKAVEDLEHVETHYKILT